MAAEFELNAELRTDKGKGASRRLRRNADQVPAIIYGAGKDPLALSISHKDLHRACENEAFFSHIITINADGKPEKAVLKDLQRHPAKDRIMHADFFRVSMDKAIVVVVPLHFINEESCAGVKTGGGVVSHTMTSLEISCLPGDLPEYIEVDIQELELGDSIHMSGIIIPDTLSIPELAHGEDHDQIVVAVHAPRRVETAEDETDAADADGAEATDESSDESSSED